MSNPPVRRQRSYPPAGVLALVSTLVLAACGQKGPLYLPETVGEVVTRPTQTAPAESAPGAPATSPPAPAPSAPKGEDKTKPATPPPIAR